MSDKFTDISGLQLTDDDLRALGAVIAHWAIAEFHVRFAAYNLISCCPEMRKILDRVFRGMGFDQVLKEWKKALAHLCREEQEYLRIGRDLADRAKYLGDFRNSASHWPASRDGQRPEAGINFNQIAIPGPPELKSENFDTDRLILLAEEIYMLGNDFGRFGFCLLAELSLVPIKVDGVEVGGEIPIPEDFSLRNRVFRSIENPQN